MTDNNNNEMFVVQSDEPERLFVKVYHDFLDSKLLDRNEKMIFILLKRYLDFRKDKSGISGEVYPTLESLAEKCKMSKGAVIRTIKSLEEKKIISVERSNGYNKPNVYTINDFKEMWQSETQEEMSEKVRKYNIQKAIELLKKEGIIKEKWLDSTEPTKEQLNQAHELKFDIVNTTIRKEESQEVAENEKQERYTLEEVKALYDYDVMINDRAEEKESIDAVIDIIYDVLNTKKKTIRVSGEDKPAIVVIKKLMKLNYSEIMYCIDKFNEKTERIKNTTAYMLTLLYNAKERMHFDISNQVQHDMYNF